MTSQLPGDQKGQRQMFGLINRAFERFILRDYGVESWNAIRHAANIETSTFISMDVYDDEMSFRLFEVAAQHLDYSLDDLLERFGESWVDVGASAGFGPVMRLGGSNLTDFILNLDNLHTRLGLTFSALRPPSFRVELTSSADHSPCIRLHYRSDRQGLTSFVVGVLRGLGKHFNEPVDVRIEQATQGRQASFLVQPLSRHE